MNVTAVETALGVSFDNKLLLLQAITHRSYLNEHKSWPVSHNQRLEFLGDAVLEIIVTEYLYNEYPSLPEGILTQMRSNTVDTVTLADVSRKLDLDSYTYLSNGERKACVKETKKRSADFLEAVIGAIYLDQGLDVVREFIRRTIIDTCRNNIQDEPAKSRFQNHSQEKLGVTPVYKLLEESGPAHARSYVMGVYIGPRLVAKGTGGSKKEAETKAAEVALIVKGWE